MSGSRKNLIAAFTVENSEVAMYEALVIAAQKAEDRDTEELARRIQAEERAAADSIEKAAGAGRMV